MPHSKAVSEALVSEGESASSKDADLVLVQRVQAGDVAAFQYLVEKYRERLYSVVYNLCGNREDAADLTQDAFIKAFRSIQKFRGKSAFFTWLYRIGVNGTLSHMRKNRARRFFSFENIDEDVAASEVIERLVEKTGAERPTLLAELQERLNEALQKLSIKHRTVVVLFEIEGLSHQEIATITKTTEGTVRSRLHYAKLQLQNELKDYL